MKVVIGTISATAEDGSFTTIDGLDVGDSFNFGGSTYKQTAVGLMNGSTIRDDLADKSLSLDDLTSAVWATAIAPNSGTLDISTVTANAIVLDSATNPNNVKLGTLPAGDNSWTLTDNGSASDSIKSIQLAANKSLTVDFAAKVIVPVGTATVNGEKYNATTALTLDNDGTTC